MKEAFKGLRDFDMKYKLTETEKHLRVFEDRSEYYKGDGTVEIFPEGVVSNEAKRRIKAIKEGFENGFLDKLIEDLKDSKSTIEINKISHATQISIRNLVSLVTSEVGRALIGLSVMQLSIKAISPKQNIRLHKASASKGSFSWSEGVSMRTLDKNYVTPVLRKYDLVRLNADGFMMTRSLAENYPYSDLYKAQIRGAREDWLRIVEELESNKTDALESLKYLVSLLLNSAREFNVKANELLEEVDKKLKKYKSISDVIGIMKLHADKSDYAARLLEISMHSLMQSATESGAFGDITLKPLSQMRSANKKHGNIGDIELMENGDIIESWDAKYGKSYLREEVEEVCEKIIDHDNIQVVGFVTNTEIQRANELDRRLDEAMLIHGVKFLIVTFDEWTNMILKRCISSKMVNEETLAKSWLKAYAYTLAQKRREIAPIDEPCMEWVKLLLNVLKA